MRRKIQRKEAGWRYTHVDENGKPFRISYSLKPAEIAYKDLKKDNFKVMQLNEITER